MIAVSSRRDCPGLWPKGPRLNDGAVVYVGPQGRTVALRHAENEWHDYAAASPGGRYAASRGRTSRSIWSEDRLAATSRSYAACRLTQNSGVLPK